MSEQKLTPAEAWEHVKALCPMADHIKNALGCEWVAIADGLAVFGGTARNIDWPAGVDRWPPAEKPRRRAKMPKDWGKPAWFWDDASDEKAKGWLCGLTKTHFEHWIDEEGNQWLHAEVECDDAPLEPEWIAPTEEHIGQMVEVRDHTSSAWYGGMELSEVDNSKKMAFRTGCVLWHQARIRNPKHKG